MQVGEPCTVVGEASSTPPVELLPAATWYDNSHQQFVALLERSPSATPSLLSEVMEFRVLSYDQATKKLHPSPVTRFRLPCVLATEEHRVGTSTVLCRKIPLLSRLSLDSMLLAIQFSPTLIRIVPMEHNDTNTKHWTIDLALGGEPLSSPPHMMPTSTSRYKVHDPLGKIKETKILPGGIIWSDHGGKSQDFIVVTTGSVLCYKVSLIRKQMSFSHTFHHPKASAMWYEPRSRTVVVSSMERALDDIRDDNRMEMLLNLRTLMLRFPKTGKSKRLPRLELPPPHRLDPFTVSRTTITMTNATSENSFSLLSMQSKLALVNLYGSPHVVNISFEGSNLKITFYQLERSQGAKNVKQVVVEGFIPLREDLESIIIGVLDNVLWVCLRGSRKNIYVDVAETSEYCFIEDWAEEVESCLENPNLCFMLPAQLLDPAGRGLLYAVDLDITVLSSMMQTSYCPIPFILRRSKPEAHDIALTKFSSILKMASSSRRREWVASVAFVYAKYPNSLRKDWISCMHLIFKCALLPPGSEFRHHSIDMGCLVWPEQSRFRACQTLDQRDLLQGVLLPEAHQAVASSSGSRLSLVLDVALVLLGELDGRECPPCPALECLIVSILWRLGCFQEIDTVLGSRSIQSEVLKEFFRQNQLVTSAGTNVFISTLLALSTEVEFGEIGYPTSNEVSRGIQYVKMFRKNILSQATMILSARSSKPVVLVKYLLGQGRVLDAMSIYSRTTSRSTSGAAGMTAHSIPTNREMLRSPFFYAALLKARQQLDPAKACQVLNTLHSFLSMSDISELDNLINQPRHGRSHSFDVNIDMNEACISYNRSSLDDTDTDVINNAIEYAFQCQRFQPLMARELDLLFLEEAAKGMRDEIYKLYGLVA